MTQAYTHRFTEVYELFGASTAVFAPGAHATMAYRPMGNHQRGVAIFVVGEIGGGGTVDIQLWQAQDALGTNAKVIAGKAITQLTQAGGDSFSVVAIELRTEEMDVDGGFSYLGGILTVGVANVEMTLIGLGGCSNYVPVATTNWAEIVD